LRTSSGLPPLCTVGAAELAPPASGRTALFSIAIELAVFSSSFPLVAADEVVQLVSGFSLDGVVDCANADPTTNELAKIATAKRDILISRVEKSVLKFRRSNIRLWQWFHVELAASSPANSESRAHGFRKERGRISGQVEADTEAHGALVHQGDPRHLRPPVRRQRSRPAPPRVLSCGSSTRNMPQPSGRLGVKFERTLQARPVGDCFLCVRHLRNGPRHSELAGGLVLAETFLWGRSAINDPAWPRPTASPNEACHFMKRARFAAANLLSNCCKS
jgi:hypothetical protein